MTSQKGLEHMHKLNKKNYTFRRAKISAKGIDNVIFKAISRESMRERAITINRKDTKVDIASRKSCHAKNKK